MSKIKYLLEVIAEDGPVFLPLSDRESADNYKLLFKSLNCDCYLYEQIYPDNFE